MMRGTPEFARDPAALPGALAWFGGERNPLFEPEPGDGDPGGASPLVALGVGAAATPPSARAPPPAAAPEAALRKARAGGLLTKLPYGSAASGAKIRFFRVVVVAAAAPDAAELQWGDPKDAAASTLGSRLALRDVAAVSRGHATRTFERHANALGAASLGDPASAFSLRCPGRTLDLVAPNARDADAWATALDHLAARAREARAIADANANLPKKIPPTQIPPASTPGGGPPRTPPARPSEGFGGGALDPSPAPVPSPAPATLAARASASVSASVSASAPSPGSRASSPAVFTPAPARASASLSSLSRQGSLDRESASSAAPGAPSPGPRRRPGADAAAAFVPVASRPPPVRGEGHVALDLSDEAARRGGGGEYRGRGAGALGSIRRFANRGGGGDPIRAANASVATKEAPPLKNSEAATKPPPLPSSPPRRFGAGDLGEGDDDARRLHALTLEAFSRARHGRTKELDALFARGVDPASRDANGLTLLHMAAQNNQRKAAKLVLKRTDFARHPPRLELIDAQTNRGQTPLHFCFAYGYADLGRYLLSLGADDAIVNVHGMTCYEGLDPDEPPREGLDTPEMRERALRVRERRRLERARPGTETGFPTAFPGTNPNRSAGFATDRGAYAHGGGGRRGGAGGEEEEERFRGPAAAAPRAGGGFEGYYGGGYRGGGGGGFATDRGYYGGGYGGAEGGVGGGVGGGGVSPGPPGSADFGGGGGGGGGGAPSPLAYAPPGYSPAAAPGWGGAGYPMVVADPMAAQAAQAMVAQQQAMAMAMAAQAQAHAARAMGGAAGGAEAFDFARPASPPSPLLGRRGASAAESAWDRAAAKVPASKAASEGSGSGSRSRSRRSDAARGAARGPSRGGRSGGRDDDDDDDSSNLDSSSDDDSSNRDASAKSAPRAKESAGRGKGAPGAARRGGFEGGSSAAASYSDRRRARRTRAGTDAALKALDAAKVSAAARVAAEARAARRAFAGDGDGRRATRAAGDGAGAGEAARLDRRSARAARTEELDRAAAMRAAAMRAAGFHSSESDDVSSASEAERSGSRSGAFLRGGGGGGALPPEPTRFDERRFASLALDAAKDEDDAAKRKDAASAKEGSDASAPASASAKEGSDAPASASKEDSSVSSAYSRRRENRLRRAAEHSQGLPAPSPRDAGVSGAAQGARTALPARVASKATLVLGATRLGPRAIRAALERGDLGGEGEDARAEAVEAVRGIRGIMPSPADVAAVRAAWGSVGMDPRSASLDSDSPGSSLPPGVSPADVFFLEMGAVPNCTRRADAFLFALDPAIGSRIRSIRDAFRAFEAAAAEAARSDALAKLVAVAVALVDADRGDDEKNGGAKRNAGSPDDAAPRPSLGAKIDAARALADAEAPAGEKAPGGLLHHLATTARKKSPALLALANETPALVADVLASQPPLARQRAALAELRSACEDARGAVEEDASGSGPFAARVEQGRAARARELDAAAEAERRARRAAGEAAARFGVREAVARGGEAEAAVEALAAFARAFAGAARTLA